MLKLTRLSSGKPFGTVFIAARHIVAVYPDNKGNGSHIELTTNGNPEEPILHVQENAEDISAHPYMNPS